MNNNKPNLIMSVKRSKFRNDDPSSEMSDKEFILIRPEILRRDEYTCFFCGFTSDKYQEVHHLDDDHSNNDKDNLVTTCCLCHACCHVGLSGELGRGDIILVDRTHGITQADINNLVRSLWIAELSGVQEIKVQAMKNLARLRKLTVSARRALTTYDPSLLSEWLLKLDKDLYNSRNLLLQDYAFLPRKDAFERQILYWKNNIYNATPPEEWTNMADQLIGRLAENKFGDKDLKNKKKIIEK